MLREVMVDALVEAGFSCLAYPDAESLLAEGQLAQAGCLVTDICMPGMGGLALQARLAAECPQLPVLLVTAHGDIAMAVEALKQGAYDFVEKPLPPPQLVERVRAAWDYGLARQRERRALETLTQRFQRLTPREIEIVTQTAAGKSVKESARDLDISPRTVEHHRANIVAKLEVGSIHEMIHLYARLQLMQVASPPAGMARHRAFSL